MEYMKSILPEVRAAIVKVVPEIRFKVCKVCQGTVPESVSGYHAGVCGAFLGGLDIQERPIRLADVLRAISENGVAIRVDENGTFWHVIQPNKCFRDDTGASIWWNLALDSLDDQSEETIAFIHKILCV